MKIKMMFLTAIISISCLISACSPQENIVSLDSCIYEIITPENTYRNDSIRLGSSGYFVLETYYELTTTGWAYKTDTLYLKYNWVKIIDRR